MGIIDVTQLIDSVFTDKYYDLIEWLEECCNSRITNTRIPNKNGVIPICQSSNWRLFAISYATCRACPHIKFQPSGWILEFDQDSDLSDVYA
jgi:hypothetical protein